MVKYPNKDDKDGSAYELKGLEDYRAWKKDISLFTRFDLNENWILKLETHWLNGVDGLFSMYNPGGFPEEKMDNVCS